MEEFKYFAFISYNNKDLKWGKRLLNKLESYRLPTILCKQRGFKRKPLNPIFFAPYDIQIGELPPELKKRLRASKNLIVICSPNSAASDWVGKEIKYFYELGRGNNIHFFIVEGSPNTGNPDTKCYNPVIRELGLSENLGANIHENVFFWPILHKPALWLNQQRAETQIIAKLLNVEFAYLWQRHKRQMIKQFFSRLFFLLVVASILISVLILKRPINAKVSLKEVSVENFNLPHLSQAIVSIYLNDEIKTDTVQTLGSAANFFNIPSNFRGKNVRVTFSCNDFISLDTIIELDNNITLNVSRNPEVYGYIRTELWDFSNDIPVPSTNVFINNWKTSSDNNGKVIFHVPLEQQRTKYTIQIPEYFVTDTIFMPSGENDVIDCSMTNY